MFLICKDNNAFLSRGIADPITDNARVLHAETSETDRIHMLTFLVIPTNQIGWCYNSMKICVCQRFFEKILNYIKKAFRMHALFGQLFLDIYIL